MKAAAKRRQSLIPSHPANNKNIESSSANPSSARNITHNTWRLFFKQSGELSTQFALPK